MIGVLIESEVPMPAQHDGSVPRRDRPLIDSSPPRNRASLETLYADSQPFPMMRRLSGRSAGIGREDSTGSTSSVDLFTIAANRIGYGPRPGQRDEWVSLGANDDERLWNYVSQQLDPGGIVDTEYLNRKASFGGYTTLDKSLTQLWTEHNLNSDWPTRTLPSDEAEFDTFLRAIYSRRQLESVMSEFWRDHFSAYAWEGWGWSLWPDWMRLLRTNCFGNFHDLLLGTVQHPIMLYYLDNFQSTVAGPNENHAREMIELHTMGAPNYLGVAPWQNVPLDGNGVPIAYVDNDVYETTRALTGWSVAYTSSRGNTGEFYYDSEDHDRFQKIILQNFLPADQPDLKDGQDVIRALADHDGTARYICRKMCQRFIADNPPQSVVDAAVATWSSMRQDPFQIRETVRTILTSQEFQNTWGEKTKRPFEVVVGALRATQMHFEWERDGDDIGSFFGRFSETGHALFSWRAPNGYPDSKDKWESATTRVMTWRFILWMIDSEEPGGAFRLKALDQTPPEVRSPNGLADFWIDRILQRPMDPADRQVIVEFMAQGFNPDFDVNLANNSTYERLLMMIGLILNSPEALKR